MKTSFHSVVSAAILAAVLPLAAHATTYETASFVDESVSQGDYSIDSGTFLGATFKVASSETLTSVGGNFTAYSDGSLFAAVLNGSGNVVAETTFTPLGGDQAVALAAALTAGNYSVVFGSGLYGATGTSGLVSGQNVEGNPAIVSYAGSLTGPATAFSDNSLRVTMVTAPVPEPGALVLCATGIAFLFIASRRRAA